MSGWIPYMAAAWKGGVEEGIPTGIGLRASRPRLGIQLPPGVLGGGPGGGLVIRLPREHEGAPVDADETRSPEVGRGLERLFRRDVHGVRSLARRVGADGQGREVKGPERIADFLE